MLGPIYLKQPERVQALAYVFLLAFWRIASCSGEPLEPGGKVKTLTPTGSRILQPFEVILIICYENGRRSFPSNQVIPTRARRLLGFTPDAYLCWKSHPWEQLAGPGNSTGGGGQRGEMWVQDSGWDDLPSKVRKG